MDKDGIFQEDRWSSNEQWGYCGPDCPTHEETVTWTTDETFKMTLQYNNSVLFSGLELYGILLAGIFICGLMIVLVPVLGKITVQQPGPLSLVEECRGLSLIGRECCWRQLSYAIKNQLVASKAPY